MKPVGSAVSQSSWAAGCVLTAWTSTGTAHFSVLPFCFDTQNDVSVGELACGEHSSDAELEFAM